MSLVLIDKDRDMTNDDDQVAYLAGDDASAVDDAARAELDALKVLLADEAVWSEVPPELEESVVAAISMQAVGSAADPDAGRRPGVAADTRTTRRWSGSHTLTLAAAAAVVAVAVAGIVVTSGSDTRQELSGAFEGNGGSVTLQKFDSGWRIDLDAPGLPRRDGGEFYEAWLRNSAGVLVSIGTFNEGIDVVLWAGVPPSEFDIITVTREIADGDPASSGDRALIGTIDAD
ncbi:MAG TPA: anti-sigma factor [Ilumatobacteraceae bacterium]|nr:anti-sigma factor [Ilumatobacteraceae bacterium]